MKVLVCGGRNYNEKAIVFSTLASIHDSENITEIIHGGASGADNLADVWAKSMGIPIKEFKADWEKHGRAAGPIRNQQMIEYKPDLVVAFPGGKGTADMIKKAKTNKIPILIGGG